ncbi:hypothetical protein BJ684DRAFT_19952 [Piptocephalis cylindrospora]|uniref:ENTH domain-containing protein n=1 Tax=Piptocephalis cylindrospora TaxID=1907219 RepID=A0A4P9Y3U8_9FUNG|nr:hypothetical protein BJ684DRAFT_19952 [Piptocephalis cylindrospora]|eukprot:RKP13565.1 hypothetical protein BJ684DRAFT_19952 [Piptocephalis cylindrospora]
MSSLWEVKDLFAKVKASVLNYTEYEAKVHEATNNEAWGASSTLMQEIAQGTYNYQYFNEIMPTVYKRFVEKEPHQWRQIYKALTLLEYLVKNGAERVVDDARSRIRTISALRSFHYIDNNGKDQGLNVRNRSKELVNLLNETDSIKFERAKAKHNRKKYQGHSSTAMTSGGGYSGAGGDNGFGSRYGGFGSESIPGTGSYSSSSSPSSSSARSNITFRDASGTNAALRAAESRRSENLSRNGGAGLNAGKSTSPADASPETSKQPEISLLDFDDGGFDAPASSSSNSAPDGQEIGKDDDFGDFQTIDAGNGGDEDEFGGFEQASASSGPDPFAPTPSSATAPSFSGLDDLASLQSMSTASTGTFDPFGGSIPAMAPNPGGPGSPISSSAAGMRGLTSGLQSLSMGQSNPSMGPSNVSMGLSNPSMPPLNHSSSTTSSILGSTKSSAASSSSKGGGLSSLDDLWASTKAGSFDILSSKPAPSSSSSSTSATGGDSAGLSGNSGISPGSGTASPSPFNHISGSSSSSTPAASSPPVEDKWGSLI